MNKNISDKKAYPIEGGEYDVICYRHMYCYIKNNPIVVKRVKKQMNKRFRKYNKQLAKHYNAD